MLKKIYAFIIKVIKENYKYFIFLILFAIFTLVKIPYRIKTPGGMTDLSSRYKIENRYDAKGSISETYVSEINASLFTFLVAKVNPYWDTEKKSTIALTNESYNDYLNRSKKELEESVDVAKIVALKKANYDIRISSANVVVTYILKDCPNDLKINDEIVMIDGSKIESLDQMKTIINKHQAGDDVDATILRDGKLNKIKLKLYEYEDNIIIGVMTVVKYNYESPIKIEFKYAKREYGASGGLMNTLEIYNSITQDDLTKGKKIAGTGTIDIDGNVGEIGGVKYKMLGAKKCDIFIVPDKNYKEAKKIKNKYHLKFKLISVKTFDEAIEKLEEI